jgi:hypothetical protein
MIHSALQFAKLAKPVKALEKNNYSGLANPDKTIRREARVNRDAESSERSATWPNLRAWLLCNDFWFFGGSRRLAPVVGSRYEYLQTQK